MAKPAQIRLAGTIAVTALCAALASKAAAQDPSSVLNEQIQLGDVFSGQRLDVVDARQQVTVNNAAIGNRLTGGTEGRNLAFRNLQTGFAAAVAQTQLNMQSQNSGRTTIVTQARANETSVAVNNGRLNIQSAQAAYGPARATTRLENPQANYTDGLALSSAAYGNNLSAGGRNSHIQGTVEQLSTASTVAQTAAPARYVPGAAMIQAQAVANAINIVGTGASSQRLGLNQNSQGWVGAEANASAANAWTSATTASAAGNSASLYNAGGSQVVFGQQNNQASINSRATTFAYDFGDLRAIAEGAGNQLTVGNADIWVEIDNTQINTGGVEVAAELRGHNGYDAYVGANATGNAVTGYACSDCGGIVNANNSQTNTANISATANTQLTGTNRAIITGTTATGNSASFYVTRPGN